MKIAVALTRNTTWRVGAIVLLAWSAVRIPAAEAAENIRAGAERIDEVVVTARKREENLQDVGFAVTAIGSNTLGQLRIKDARGLVLQVPSLQLQTSFGMSNPAVFLRGVGVNDVTSIASGAVSFYLDEVYVGSPAGQLLQLLDLERAEVLRGPQGTLYGRNTTAGAVNFISRNPSRKLDARVRATYGRFNETVLEGAVGGPLSETVSTRFAFISNERDGYVDNLTLGTEDSDISNWAARASLLFQPSSSFEGLFKLHAARSNAGSKRNKSQGLLDPASVAAGLAAPCESPQRIGTCSDSLGYVDTSDPYTGNWNRRGDEAIDITGASAKLTWHLPRFSLTSITGYSDVGRFIEHDTDASPNQLAEIDWLDDSEQWSQELRLSSSPDDSPDWIAGLYYFDRNVRMHQVDDVLRELRPVVGFNPMLAVFTLMTDFDAEISAYAAFGQFNFDVADQVRLIAGLRYTHERHRIDRFDRFEEPDLVIPLVDHADSVRFDDVSGKLGLEYTTEAGNLLHASISRGFKSGGFVGTVAFDPDAIPPFEEETLLSYEVGFKWTSLGGRYRLNTVGFYSDYRDLQVFTRVSTGGV